jgi:hypothetical protein
LAGSFLFSILFTVSASWAVTFEAGDFAVFLAQSTADPARVHVLRISTTWCGACRAETSFLSAFDHAADHPFNRVRWVDVEVDKVERDAYSAFAKAAGIPESHAYPTHFFFKGGQYIGTYRGWHPQRLEAAIAAAENRPQAAPAPAPPAPQRFSCGPRNTADAFVFGLSGYRAVGDSSTDEFGRANLVTYAGLFSDAPKKLFAPVPAGKPNPDSSRFNDPLLAAADMRALASVGQGNLRLLFTGHGKKNGMVLGVTQFSEYGAQHQMHETQEFLLGTTDVSEGVRAARLAGKSVRALFVQCYGGQYGEAFMSAPEAPGAGCAAFSSLPEKMSEGCYSERFKGQRRDYLTLANQLKRCDGRQDARDLHYAIVAQPVSPDIPMLTSEYFLTYGPTASYLAGGTRKISAPPRSILKKKFGAGVMVYIDRFNDRVIKAYRAATPITPPALRVVDCRRMPGRARSYSYLRSRFVDCEPVAELSFSDPAMTALSGHTVSLAPEGEDELVLEHVLPGEDALLDVSSLKPEARLFFSKILPHLTKERPGQTFVEGLDAFAQRVAATDKAQAKAILDLLRVVERESAMRGPAGLQAADLAGAILDNLGDSPVEGSRAAISRLGHLVFAALAEYELRRMTASSSEAAGLLKRLEALKECERDIL